MSPSALAESCLRGVAANTVATSSVLLRVLNHVEGRPAWRVLCQERALPQDVLEVAIAHPHTAVRASLARSRHLDPAQLGRLAGDDDPLVRNALASGPPVHSGWSRTLPDSVIEYLLTAIDPAGRAAVVTANEIREQLEGSGQIPQSFRRAALVHRNPAIRAYAARMWLFLTVEQREQLMNDPIAEVRTSAAESCRLLDPAVAEAELPERDCHYRSLILVNYAIAPAVAERCLAERRDLWAIAGNRHTPYPYVEQLARDPDPAVRAHVASRCDLAPDLLARLAQDPEAVVRTRALVHAPPRTEPQRRVIDFVIGRSADEIGQAPAWFNPPEAEWFKACAVSEHPLLRRVAATFSDLPADLVDRLAHDPDQQVRHLLAHNHPLAPPQLLLEAYLTGHRQRGRLLADPRMPRSGLGDLLDHGDPEVRALAAADMSLAEPPLAQLADPDPRVRNAAAANPLLPADTLTHLLTDPDRVEAAASNPLLTAEQLHDLLTRAGIPGQNQAPYLAPQYGSRTS